MADEPMDTSAGNRPIKRQCTAHVPAGRQGRRAAIRGGTVCASHGGSAGQVKLAAARREAEAGAVAAFGRYPGSNGDGGQAASAVNIVAELGRLIGKVTRFTDFAEARLAALTPDDWQRHDARTAAEVGMFLRAATECRKLLRDVARLGLEKWALRLLTNRRDEAKRRGTEMALVMNAVLHDLELTREQWALVPEVVPRRFRELPAPADAAALAELQALMTVARMHALGER